MSRRRQALKLIIGVIVIGLWLLILIAPGLIQVVRDLAGLLIARDSVGFTHYVHSFGTPGIIVLWLVQAFQVFIPIFPEVILQITAGATYGVWGGTLILMSSYTICNYIVFILLRHYHLRLPDHWYARGPLKKCRRLIDTHSPDTVVFILYLFPFLSNCFVPFLAVQTGITFRHYAVIMLISCLPMMFTSVYLGDRLLAQDWVMAAVAFIVGALMSIVLYLGQNKILAWKHQGQHDKKQECQTSD